MIMKILNGFYFSGLMLASILTMACGTTWDTGQWYGQAIATCFILMSLVLAYVAVLVLVWRR